jgi:hypothetical protein
VRAQVRDHGPSPVHVGTKEATNRGALTLARAIHLGTSLPFQAISSGQRTEPRADEPDRKRDIRMSGCQSPTGWR